MNPNSAAIVLKNDEKSNLVKSHKEKLDLELINQEQYDEKKSELGKYIL